MFRGKWFVCLMTVAALVCLFVLLPVFQSPLSAAELAPALERKSFPAKAASNPAFSIEVPTGWRMMELGMGTFGSKFIQPAKVGDRYFVVSMQVMTLPPAMHEQKIGVPKSDAEVDVVEYKHFDMDGFRGRMTRMSDKRGNGAFHTFSYTLFKDPYFFSVYCNDEATRLGEVTGLIERMAKSIRLEESDAAKQAGAVKEEDARAFFLKFQEAIKAGNKAEVMKMLTKKNTELFADEATYKQITGYYAGVDVSLFAFSIESAGVFKFLNAKDPKNTAEFYLSLQDGQLKLGSE